MAEKKRPRRRPRSRHTLEIIRALETLPETPDNSAAITGLADVLAWWTLYMVKTNPTAAAHIYSALVAAWRDNRAELDAGDASPARDHAHAEARERSAAIDQETVAFHVRFLALLAEATDQPARQPSYPSEKRQHAELTRFMQEQVIAMFVRLSDSGAAPPRESQNNDGRVAELRAKLERIERLPENEAMRFQIEGEIWKLENESSADDVLWPELIAA